MSLKSVAFVFLALLWPESLAQVFDLTLTVKEDLPAKTIVGDLGTGFSTPSTGFFISESGDSYVLRDLEIDPDTGIISTAVVLDRESRDVYEFVAAALTGEMIRVKILVEDVNDHSPVFPSEEVELAISELSPIGSRFQLEGAEDQDQGEFGTRGYRITDSTVGEKFQLEYRNGNLDLILVSKLDREAQDSNTLTIEAFDGGIPAGTGTLRVNVLILDENDSPPVFNQTEYHASILENAPVSSSVCQVHATDLDQGDNARITYEINRRQSDPHEVFTIDETTGEIHLNKPLDFEANSFYELIVDARDNGAQPEQSSTHVGVKVLNVNDNSPAINVMFLSETGDAVVSEAASLGDYVARISVSDPDYDMGQITVALEGGEDKFSLKQTDDFLYALCVNAELDREVKDLYDLKVLATDSGSPPLSSETTLLVRVTDSNDCPPVFDRDVYWVDIREDAPVGTSLTQVRAQDADDAGANSRISYSVLGSNQDRLISVDPATGLVTTAAGLDRERQAEVRILLVAEDGGEPALTSTATVALRIEDVNDNEPMFLQPLYDVSVPEHSDPGTCFLQVAARDLDSAEFGSLVYSLSDGFDQQNQHSLFQVRPQTGELCVSGNIDRDTGTTFHDIVVRVEDPGGLSAQTYVHIEVEDLNDNAPVFNPADYTTSISIHTQPGAELLTVLAADPDSGRFGQVVYQILPGDLSSMFTMDKHTGTLFLTSALTHLSAAGVKLHVAAQDGGGLTSGRPAEITISVVRSARAPAVFQRSRYSFRVPEDAAVGSSVATVEAANSGADSEEPVFYRISSGDPRGSFSVHPTSGLISTVAALDHELQPYALLVLQAYSGSSPVYSTTQVNITVADLNDNAPVFPKPDDSITVSQNTPPGTVVFIAHAHDQDGGANGRVRYFLKSGLFVIDRTFGIVMLNESLQAETRHELMIVARDEGEPSLSSTLTLTISVDHTAAEHNLSFETLVYQVEIGEGYRVDARVIQVRAHQSRDSHTTSIAYSLEDEVGFPPAPFRIHPQTGWLYLTRNLDYETEPVFRFKALATTRDGADAAATVTVQVLDANDNAPKFSSDTYYFTVSEGTSPQALVGKVEASDEDSGKNARLTYMLLSDGKFFRVNAKTGEIFNWVALDREQHCQQRLKVMVTDQGNPRLNSTATVHILVTDVNDNAPRFTHLPASKEINIQVWAGVPAGSLVTTMFAKDVDAGENGTVAFSLVTDDVEGTSGHFGIDSRTGDIRTTDLFGEEVQQFYTLRVSARDEGSPSLQEVATVHVQVHGVEAHYGHAEQLVVRMFSVKEDTAPGTIIGSAGVSDRGRLHYSIVEGDGSVNFGIDDSSGDIYVYQPLDYESAVQFFLLVRAEDVLLSPGANTSVLVSVTVEDVNDHPPWFPDPLVTLSVREDAAVGSEIFAFHAKDADGTFMNSNLRYYLTSDSGHAPFQVNPQSGRLTVNASLDRETTRSFALTVSATDQPTRRDVRRQAWVTAQVFLLDVNDNRPVFTSGASAQVMEDAEVGSLLHHFITSDADEGDNQVISYFIVAGDTDGRFTLGEKTGLLYLSAPLDFETQSFHRLTVRAVDHGHPSLSSTHTFTVEVVDVNDQPPVFTQDFYNVSVFENKDPGEAVTRVLATDNDSDVNAALWYSLLPGPDHELFRIDPYSGVITTTSGLDREKQQTFTLRVRARDSGAGPLSGTATVLCTVLDNNDNPPQFMQSSFQIRFPENSPAGVIYTARATDPDQAENGTIHYSIIGADPKGRFTINSHTGEVGTNEILDREDKQNYTLTIQARDYGAEPLHSTMQLHLVLLDLNDNVPTFLWKQYQTAVSEALLPGSQVLQVSALDPDEGPNGEISYSLTEDGSHGTFSIDETTGVIRTLRALDREKWPQYTVHVVATDGCGQGPLSSSVSVTIHVDDVNDNIPVCKENPMEAWISTRSLTNEILTVTATDGDRGENGTVRFFLSDDDNLFDVNPSGEITLKTRKEDVVSGKKLQVVVSDGGRPALTSTCLVFVHLKGEVEQLLFTNKVYNTTVEENSPAGTWIGQVEAVDQSNSQQRITYNILTGNEEDVLSINSHTGEIRVQKDNALDYETNPQMELVVLAENGLQSTYCKVTIALLDINDNRPVFEHDTYRAAIWEEQVLNTSVLQVFAFDSDGGLNGQIEYSITAGNHNEAFALDSTLGILRTNVLLDREIISSYRLVLQATDRGSHSLSGTSTVIVWVVDVNDNSPTVHQIEPIVIAENLPAGYMVTQVTANDADLSSAVTYSFPDDAKTDGPFAIDLYTGVITLTRSLDYQEQSEYILRICASDSIHQTTGEVKVQVMDVNDNPPLFTEVSYQVELYKSVPEGTFILSVSATDQDSGKNGKISYRLLSSNSHGFYINSNNGSIYTNRPMRTIETNNSVALLVEARDEGDPVRSSVTTVDVLILDTNDHAPTFSQDVYTLTVPEDTLSGTTLLTLLADDKDPDHTNLEFSIIKGNEEKIFCLELQMIQLEKKMTTVGQLILCKPLDRETTEHHAMTVSVSDRGTPPMKSNVLVMVTVSDCNDNPPSFSSHEYNVQVSENSLFGTTVVQIRAQDPDLGTNGLLKYNIISGNNKGHFRLDEQSGILIVSNQLDYEEETKYTLTIRATDGIESSEDRNVAFAIVFVTIMDENDNTPYFMFPSFNCSVLENQPAFTHACSVRAIDKDSGPYGLLTYSILSSCSMDYSSNSPARREAFAIDALTGDIHTRQTFDYEHENDSCFVVEARDKGDRATTATVQMRILGVDEFSPIFTQKQYNFFLPEKTKTGTTVGYVMAMDHDRGIDGMVAYSLVNSSPFFAINRTTGSIFVSNHVFRRRGGHAREDMVELVLSAGSPRLGSRTSTCLVSINISSSAEALTGASLDVHVFSLGVALATFLIVLVIFVSLVLRYKMKKAALKKASRQNNFSGTLGQESDQINCAVSLMEIKRPSVLVTTRDTLKTYTPTDSSGRGSAEGETAEDQEIKWINEYYCHERERGKPPEVSDSALPGDSISCHSIDVGPQHFLTFNKGMVGTESMHTFREEGGGEGLLSATLRVKDLEESVEARGYASLSDTHALAESLSSILFPDEHMYGHYNWEQFLEWEPRFHTLASVFTDISMLPDQTLPDGCQRSAVDSFSLMHPPPLITGVAQPGIRTVVPRMPARDPSLRWRPSYPRYAYSPLGRNTGLTPSAMTPTFTPSLTSFTMRTPSASPVLDTRVRGIRFDAGPPTASLLEAEIQV